MMMVADDAQRVDVDVDFSDEAEKKKEEGSWIVRG